MSKKITVHYEGKPLYDISIERDFSGLKDLLCSLGVDGRKVCIVTDSHVGPLYSNEILSIAKEVCSLAMVFSFEAGEQSKTLDVIEDLYEELIKAKFDRKDYLIALGGGVVGDMTGFAAATYLRGIKVIQMPTSLLSMVDSSIGGKTGVDFRGYKNMIGAFHQPSAVYMNLNVLNTLTEDQYFSGFGEIIKHGLIKDTAYFDQIQSGFDDLVYRDIDRLEEIIFGSCNIKRLVVENDPKEQGERALLNFGHTLGHAIEKSMNFQLLHGDCVAIGMVAATYLSCKRGLVSKDDLDKVVDILKKMKLPTSVQGLDANDLLQISKSDKKMNAGQIRFILLDKIGHAIMVDDISDQDLLDSLNYVLD